MSERYVELGPIEGVDLRPVGDEDLPFLAELYASTREEELAPVPWSAEQKRAFLASQFVAQHRHYQEHYAGARFDVISVRDGDELSPVGRLYLARLGEDLRIVDIALMPSHRGLGLGGRVLRAVLDRADELSLPTSVHVERNNPALRLYERLGFELSEDRGVYLFLVRPRHDR